jgi:Tol biopolymer transport system component
MKRTLVSLLACLMYVCFASSAFGQVKIAYISNEEGNYNIYVLTLDEELNFVSKTKLTEWTSFEQFPCWSNDGQKLAFESNHDGSSEVWIMDEDGSGITKITDSSKSAGPQVWSLDEQDIYGLNSSAGDGEVAIFDVTTGDITMLTDIPGKNTMNFDLNSDQTRITFVRGNEGNAYSNELFIADFESDGNDFFNVIKLTDAMPAPTDPKFSPDNSRIVFGIKTSESMMGLGIINADGSVFWTPIPIEGKRNHKPAWINNYQIVYAHGDYGREDLWVLDLRDMSKTQLTDNSFHETQPKVFYAKTVQIDLKPGSYPNSINLGSNGNVPVAIFSDENFDATTVDPISIRLAGATVRIKGKGDPQANLEDVDGDGLMDIVAHVDTRALELSAEDTEAILTGLTYDGVRFEGVDTVRIVNE